MPRVQATGMLIIPVAETDFDGGKTMIGQKQKKIGIALLMCLLTSLWMANVHAGAYMGAAMGQSIMHDEARGATVEVDMSDETLGWKIFGGGFKKWWGVEGGYAFLGDHKDTNKSNQKAFIESEGWTLQGLGILPLHEKFMLYGKAGIIAWDQDLRFNNGLGRNDDGTDFAGGAGFWWRPNTFFGVRVEWEYYDMETTVHMTTGSIVLHFN